MKNRKLVISTGNQNKINEISYILKDLHIDLVSKKDIGAEDLYVVEDGATLEENSILKARALAEKTNYMVMADDSGLFVDALKGEPGIHSSRYGGEEGNDRKNNEKLLKKLKGLPIEDRTAKFKTIIVLLTEDREIIKVEGECQGSIGLSPKGKNGFGYDPLFTPKGYNKTFGELGAEVKNKISHRAKALKELRKEIEKII